MCVCVCVYEFRAFWEKTMAGLLVDLLVQGFSLKNLKNKSLEGDFSLGGLPL